MHMIYGLKGKRMKTQWQFRGHVPKDDESWGNWRLYSSQNILFYEDESKEYAVYLEDIVVPPANLDGQGLVF